MWELLVQAGMEAAEQVELIIPQPALEVLLLAVVVVVPVKPLRTLEAAQAAPVS